MFNFKKHTKQNAKSTKPEKLMTPQEYAVYVAPNLQYQPILSRQQQDAVLADFTARFNDYLKMSAKRITRNTRAVCIPERYLSEDYVYYDKDTDKYHLLDFIANYLNNHGWEFELKSGKAVNMSTSDVNMNTGLVLKLWFDYEKYAKQAKDDK